MKKLTKRSIGITAGILMAALSVWTVQAQEFDVLLKGGHVIDPKNNVDGIMDVAISGTTIARVEPNIPVNAAKKVVDVAGLYVTPGIIDMHTHVFHGTSEARFRGFQITDGF